MDRDNTVLNADNCPEVTISNGPVTAKVWTPDAEIGYYRATRFDWSGIISSLCCNGHEYFGPWRDAACDPAAHDNVSGPAESFMANDAVLGYDEAGVGETFMRIGVGLCEKPQEDGYTWSKTYTIVDPGKWTITQGKNWVEFTHELADAKGYAYKYTKRLTLPEGRTELVIAHALENTGEKGIETEVFNHNFFTFNGCGTGPDFEVEFPFDVRADRDLNGLVEVGDKKITYLKEFEDGESVYTGLEGFGQQIEDNAFRVVNHKTGAAVSVQTNLPLYKLFFWTINRTLCPEPFVFMTINPGQTQTWDSQYEFSG